MAFPKYEGGRTHTDHFWSPHKASAEVTEFHPMELIVKGFNGNSQTTQDAAKTIDCSLQTEIKVPSMKTTSAQLIKPGKVELEPTVQATKRKNLDL